MTHSGSYQRGRSLSKINDRITAILHTAYTGKVFVQTNGTNGKRKRTVRIKEPFEVSTQQISATQMGNPRRLGFQKLTSSILSDVEKFTCFFFFFKSEQKWRRYREKTPCVGVSRPFPYIRWMHRNSSYIQRIFRNLGGKRINVWAYRTLPQCETFPKFLTCGSQSQ